MLQIELLKGQPNRRSGNQDCFKAVLLTVAIGAILCAISASVIAFWLPAITANEQKVFDALLSSFTLAVGAIGLMGRAK